MMNIEYAYILVIFLVTVIVILISMLLDEKERCAYWRKKYLDKIKKDKNE